MSKLRVADLVRYSDHYNRQHCITNPEPDISTVVAIHLYVGEGGTVERWPEILNHRTKRIGRCHPLNVTRVKAVARYEDDPQEL